MSMCPGPRTLTRRGLLALGLGAALGGRAAAQAVLTEDGLHRQPWFIDSLLELADDLAAASREGRRFAVLWELRGCPYCRKMHEVNFAQAEIAGFVRERFDILQLNIIGDREVVDFDGQRLSEKRLAAKYGVRATPTFQFFRRETDLGSRPPGEREVARMQGYIEPAPFLATFRRIAEGGKGAGPPRPGARRER